MGNSSCRNVLLDDVIEMLDNDPVACSKKSFTFAVSPDDKLYEQHMLYRNLPSPLKHLTKGIANANDSLKLERSEKLKKNNLAVSRLAALKGITSATDSLRLPRTEGLKRVSALSGITSATDSLRLPRTDGLKRVSQEYLDNKK